jgi:hypothetical protein
MLADDRVQVLMHESLVHLPSRSALRIVGVFTVIDVFCLVSVTIAVRVGFAQVFSTSCVSSPSKHKPVRRRRRMLILAIAAG